MSGGSFNYMYSKILETYSGELKDPELEMLLTDFCKVLKDLEWFESSDIGAEAMQKSVDRFKEKWHRKDDPRANLPAELKPLVNKVAEVLPGLVDAIVEQLPEIISKAIKCGECPYYKNAGPKAVIIRDQFGHEMLGYYEELLEIIFTPIGFLDPEKAKKKGYTVEEITNQPENSGGTENES